MFNKYNVKIKIKSYTIIFIIICLLIKIIYSQLDFCTINHILFNNNKNFYYKTNSVNNVYEELKTVNIIFNTHHYLYSVYENIIDFNLSAKNLEKVLTIIYNLHVININELQTNINYSVLNQIVFSSETIFDFYTKKWIKLEIQQHDEIVKLIKISEYFAKSSIVRIIELDEFYNNYETLIFINWLIEFVWDELTKQYLFDFSVNTVCKINYILMYINNLYDVNFFFMAATVIFIFIIYYNNILIYKTINLYMFLLYLVTMFSFFGLNPYVGFLVLVELMTITYITILVLNFTNYFLITNKNKFNKYLIYIMFVIYPFLAEYYLIFWVSDDLIFSYYDFYDFILTNDFIGIYIYLYFDNTQFMLSIALAFILFSVLFIKIIFVSFIEKVKNVFSFGTHLASFFFEFKVNFYEKNFFWEKDFINVVNLFR